MSDFLGNCGTEYGYKSTLESAFELYAKIKKDAIVKIANEYKDIIPKKLYKALLEYNVLIDIDKNYVA